MKTTYNFAKRISFAFALALSLFGNDCFAQVPPVSDPVCIYCGANRSDGPRREEHRPGYPCFQGNTQMSQPVGDHHTITYNPQQQTVYVPPTPVRDTPEGKAMLKMAGAAGHVLGTLAVQGLFKLAEKIFHGGSKVEYHNSNPDKQWGTLGIREMDDGKEGIFNNATHKWAIKPGKYKDFHMVELNGSPARSVKTGKWGLVSLWDGEEVVPCQYDEIISYGFKSGNCPHALGKKDANGQMHWKIGKVRDEKPWDFVYWDGEYSYVDFAERPDPFDENGYGKMAVFAKDSQTGKTKIFNYDGGVSLGARPEEEYDHIQLTGLTLVIDKKDKLWNDYFKVTKNGKMGFISQLAKQGGEYYKATELLPCEYDNVIPLSAEAYIYQNIYNQVDRTTAKQLVITEKDGKFGLGHYDEASARDPQYDDIGIISIKDNEGNLQSIAITKEGNKYIARDLLARPVTWEDESPIEADDFLKVVDLLNESTQKNSFYWYYMKHRND